MVYAGSATIDGQPVLSPPQLMNGITRLDQTLQKLEHTIRDIIGDYNGKLKVSWFLIFKTRLLFYIGFEALHVEESLYNIWFMVTQCVYLLAR